MTCAMLCCVPLTHSLRRHRSKCTLKRLNELPRLLKPDTEPDEILFDAPLTTLFVLR